MVACLALVSDHASHVEQALGEAVKAGDPDVLQIVQEATSKHQAVLQEVLNKLQAKYEELKERLPEQAQAQEVAMQGINTAIEASQTGDKAATAALQKSPPEKVKCLIEKIRTKVECP